MCWNGEMEKEGSARRDMGLLLALAEVTVLEKDHFVTTTYKRVDVNLNCKGVV
jgi:hypothetical protein